MFDKMWLGVIGWYNSPMSQEMYPPKVHQFAYVTDEACTEDEILSMEIIIMKVNKCITRSSMTHQHELVCMC